LRRSLPDRLSINPDSWEDLTILMTTSIQHHNLGFDYKGRWAVASNCVYWQAALITSLPLFDEVQVLYYGDLLIFGNLDFIRNGKKINGSPKKAESGSQAGNN
jgi:hypothetical protein